MRPPETHYACNGDVHLAYQVVGDGPVDLVIAPGFISHCDLNWTMPAYVDFIERLALLSRVILFDKRGTGLSDVSLDAASFEARMSDIGIVMDAARSERAVLFGYSEGGPMACLYAATHPDRVESLILDGTFASGRCIPERMIHRMDDAIDNWGQGRTAGIFLGDLDRPAIRRFMGLYERASASPGIARRLLQSVLSCDVTPILPHLYLPTTVIHRRDDPFAPVEWGRELADAIPDARFVEIEGTAHLPFMGDAAVTDAIEFHLTGDVSNHPATRTLATVMFTDIVDSTETLSSVGDERWADTIQHHNDISRQIFEDVDAWAVKSTGDGFMACFPTPEQGVQCAQRIQAVMALAGLDLRAGLHTGEIERIDVDDITGLTVNIAARISSLAGPNEILTSRLTGDLLVGSRHDIRTHGTHNLKGVPTPVDVVSIGHPTVPNSTSDIGPSIGIIDRLTLGAARRVPAAIRALSRLISG